jgi:hypothetical protein
MTTVDDFLASGGVPTAKFPDIGDAHKGVILSMEKRQARDIDNNPKTWDDGSPVMQWVIDLATDERDPAITDDDGTRRLYVKGGKAVGTKGGKSLEEAIRDATRKLAETGYKGTLVGCELAVRYLEDGEPSKRGFSGPKLYKAQLTAPLVDIDDF